MRRITIIENDVGALKQYAVETSSGVRATGASLGSALSKLWPAGERPPDYVEFEKLLVPILNGVLPTRTGQIREGVDS